MNGEAALAITTALANKPTMKKIELNGMYIITVICPIQSLYAQQPMDSTLRTLLSCTSDD